MKELLINQIAPILATTIIGILVVIIKSVGGAATELFVAKKKEAELKIKASGHEEELNTAKEVWSIVEEKFRITENASQILGNKADEFDKLLLRKIPGLTKQNLSDLRQAIAGEFNKDKAVVLQDDATKQIAELQKTNESLLVENQNLKSTITQISSAIQPVSTENQQATV